MLPRKKTYWALCLVLFAIVSVTVTDLDAVLLPEAASSILALASAAARIFFAADTLTFTSELYLIRALSTVWSVAVFVTVWLALGGMEKAWRWVTVGFFLLVTAV